MGRMITHIIGGFTIKRVPGLMLLTLIATTGLLGCGQYSSPVADESADLLTVPLPSVFAAEPGEGNANLYFYRINSRKTGERLGLGHSFMVEEHRQVRAVFQLEGLKPAEPILLHFLWLNPNGKKARTQDIFISSEDWHADSLSAELQNARVKLDLDTGTLEAESRYGVSPFKFEREADKAPKDRTFMTGTWSVRVYLYRKWLMTGRFELGFEDDE